MAYVPGNLICFQTDIGNQGPAFWTLRGTDAASVARVTGFITDGGSKGMKVGDLVYAVDSDTANYVWTAYSVATVSATYPGAVDITNLTAVTITTNGD